MGRTNWLGSKRQEYFGRFLGDLAKAVFAVGLASHLFKDFPALLRIVCGVGFLLLAILSVWMHPRE